MRFQQESGYLENGVVWEEIAGKMACLGFDRSAKECKQIWDEISMSLSKTRPLSVGLHLTDNDLSRSSSNAAAAGSRSGYA
ncbi:hypothetical protein L6164_006845 [Bauhinia variegata]|nr:hypothetical protein L6164_006845 [Bauhinia variegata]